VAATSFPGLAQQQEAGHGGCYVTLSPTDATRVKRSDKLRPTEAASTGAPWVRVVVRKVDLPATRITVAHGAIHRIRTPAMTIQNIPVTDAAYLASLRGGDEIEIQCDHSGGVARIVNIRIGRKSRVRRDDVDCRRLSTTLLHLAIIPRIAIADRSWPADAPYAAAGAMSLFGLAPVKTQNRPVFL
jgi:Cu/Ag efflux protein CusF